MFREVLSKYPLVANAASLGTSILYPQVGLLEFSFFRILILRLSIVSIIASNDSNRKGRKSTKEKRQIGK